MRFLLIARIYDFLFSQMKNIKSVMNKPLWPQIMAFWQATQLWRKFDFWQQTIAICWATSCKMFFQFIFMFWVSLSIHDVQSTIYNPHATMLNISKRVGGGHRGDAPLLNWVSFSIRSHPMLSTYPNLSYHTCTKLFTLGLSSMYYLNFLCPSILFPRPTLVYSFTLSYLTLQYCFLLSSFLHSTTFHSTPLNATLRYLTPLHQTLQYFAQLSLPFYFLHSCHLMHKCCYHLSSLLVTWIVAQNVCSCVYQLKDDFHRTFEQQWQKLHV